MGKEEEKAVSKLKRRFHDAQDGLAAAASHYCNLKAIDPKSPEYNARELSIAEEMMNESNARYVDAHYEFALGTLKAQCRKEG